LQNEKEKPPDKLIRLKMSSCSTKEFNEERRRTKAMKEILKKENNKLSNEENDFKEVLGKLDLSKIDVEENCQILLAGEGQKESLNGKDVNTL
jgi:hypothetical protein